MTDLTCGQGSVATADQVASTIRKFIFENFLFGAQDDAIGNDDSFLEKGIIDSTGILEIVNYLEEEFGVKVEDDEILPENLDSVSRIVAYVGRKLSA